MRKENEPSDGNHGPGCAATIVAGLVVWAFLFGVTWDGRHYDVSCTCRRGVVVNQKAAP
jgi:hypothetical protein